MNAPRNEREAADTLARFPTHEYQEPYGPPAWLGWLFIAAIAILIAAIAATAYIAFGGRP